MTTHKQRSRAPTDAPSTPRSAPHTSFTHRITRLIALILAVAITAWTTYMVVLVATGGI